MGEVIALPVVEAQRILTIRELAERQIGGMVCQLFWNSEADSVFIRLKDTETDVEFSIPNDKALDAYYHPHSYRPQGIYNRYWDESDGA